MSCRLLALDLDGTTVLHGLLPTPGVVRAVSLAQERGVHVVLATGRPYQSAVRYAEALQLCNPIVCFQGALVKEVDNERATLLAEGMPHAPLLDLIAFAEQRDLELTLYSERALYATALRQPKSFYELWFGLDTRQVGNLYEGLHEINAQGLCPLKALFIGDPAYNGALTVELQAHFAGRLDIVRSHDLFVEAVSPIVSKGRALARMAEWLGVTPAETVAVGDSGNDLSMIRWAGVGVAVANASPDVIAAADWIAPPVEEDGVAAVVERYVIQP